MNAREKAALKRIEDMRRRNPDARETIELSRTPKHLKKHSPDDHVHARDTNVFRVLKDGIATFRSGR